MIPLNWLILLSLSLFSIGLFGVIARRNLLFILISLEIMLNAVALLFITGASLHPGVDGHIVYLLILALAAAEVAIGLALVITMYRQYHTLDVDKLSKMKG